jgi:hypothetical protein
MPYAAALLQCFTVKKHSLHAVLNMQVDPINILAVT